MQKKEYSIEVGGRTLTATFTDLADQATGSVLVRYGETVVLATAVMSHFERTGMDYFPLTVEYEEKFYAAGRILGGRFQKREGRPSDEAILGGRIVDRTIRPLFNQEMRNDIQVVLTTLSIDEENDPDVPAVIGASLALATSPIPWNGPVSAVRVGIPNREPSSASAEATAGEGSLEGLSVNPPYSKRDCAELDLLICGKDGKINMIESEAKQIPENKIVEAFELATAEIEKIQAWQKQIIAEIGKPKFEIKAKEKPEGMEALFAEAIAPKFKQAIFIGVPGKSHINDLKDEWMTAFKEKFPEANPGFAEDYYEHKIDELIHQEAIENNDRPDGRAMDQLRPLYTQAGGLSSIVHGAGIFYRGGTHVLSVLTLAGPKDSQLVEGMEVRGKKYFMHHYNFPPFSVGETGRLGGINRRSVGHGALAEKSLRGVIPSREEFPYTIRLVSEALASNGSTSMGSVCGSTLALMDGGVPIKAPVAGIAMGLMSHADGRYKILTDIQGPEDHHGDMDFKVAGTRNGVTGIQLDIKIDAIPVKILAEALEQAKKARIQIIEKIEEAIPAPRTELSPSAPRIEIMKVPTDKIGAIIGPGGKIIQGMQEETDTTIEIEDDGTVYISGKVEGVTAAKKMIDEIAHVYKAGERFNGKVVRIEAFGAFVEIGRDTDGLVHVSEIAPFRIDKVEDALKLGDVVPVIIKEIDDKNRVSLSIKQADPDWAKNKGLIPSTSPLPPRTSGNSGYNGGNDRRNNNSGGNGFRPRQ